jgi:hypothetical protein
MSPGHGFDDSGNESEEASEYSEDSDDGSVDFLATARQIDPNTIRNQEREYDAAAADRLAEEIVAGSSAATAGGGSGFNTPAVLTTMGSQQSSMGAQRQSTTSESSSSRTKLKRARTSDTLTGMTKSKNQKTKNWRRWSTTLDIWIVVPQFPLYNLPSICMSGLHAFFLDVVTHLHGVCRVAIFDTPPCFVLFLQCPGCSSICLAIHNITLMVRLSRLTNEKEIKIPKENSHFSTILSPLSWCMMLGGMGTWKDYKTGADEISIIFTCRQARMLGFCDVRLGAWSISREAS